MRKHSLQSFLMICTPEVYSEHERLLQEAQQMQLQLTEEAVGEGEARAAHEIEVTRMQSQ